MRRMGRGGEEVGVAIRERFRSGEGKVKQREQERGEGWRERREHRRWEGKGRVNEVWRDGREQGVEGEVGQEGWRNCRGG